MLGIATVVVANAQFNVISHHHLSNPPNLPLQLTSLNRLIQLLPKLQQSHSELLNHLPVLFGVFYLILLALLDQAHYL